MTKFIFLFSYLLSWAALAATEDIPVGVTRFKLPRAAAPQVEIPAMPERIIRSRYVADTADTLEVACPAGSVVQARHCYLDPVADSGTFDFENNSTPTLVKVEASPLGSTRCHAKTVRYDETMRLTLNVECLRLGRVD